MTRSLKTSVEAMNEIKSILIDAGIPALLNGEIRIFQRRLGSKTEDCVINTLLWDADQFQGGIFNVNFHVPNLVNQPAANPTTKDNTQPDIVRMEQLGKVAAAALDAYEDFDFSLSLRNPGKVEGFGNEWLYNIQVNYLAVRRDIAG